MQLLLLEMKLHDISQTNTRKMTNNTTTIEPLLKCPWIRPRSFQTWARTSYNSCEHKCYVVTPWISKRRRIAPHVRTVIGGWHSQSKAPILKLRILFKSKVDFGKHYKLFTTTAQTKRRSYCMYTKKATIKNSSIQRSMLYT